MRILIINTLYYPNQIGGAEKSVQILAENLVTHGHEVCVVCLDQEGLKSKYINGVIVYYLGLKNIYWPFQDIKRNFLQKTIWHFIDTYIFPYRKDLRKVIHTFKPEIIHTNNISGFTANIFKFLKKEFKLPIVHTSRDYYLLCFKGTMFKNGRTCDSICFDCNCLSYKKLKNVNDNVDTFIGISSFILKEHLKFGLSKNLNNGVIYNPVNNIVLENKKKEVSIICFGFIGALNSAKGIENILLDFMESPIADYNWKFYVAGRGSSDFENYLKSKFNDPRIEFLGYMNHAEFYNKIDVLMVPSCWNEPFGRVVIEASSLGIPVLVSDVGGLSELEEIISTVDFLTISKIEEILRNGLDNRNQLDKLDKFKEKEVMEKYLLVYDQVINLRDEN